MKIFFLFLVSYIFLACSPKSLKKPIYNTTVFRGERGKKEVNAYNKNRADREKDMAEAIEKADAAKKAIEEQKKQLASIDSVERISVLDLKLQQVFKRTQEIINELNSVSPYTSSGHEKALKLSAELNDLMYNQINPLAEMIESNKDVVRLSSDISFETGSATLSKEGKKQVSVMIQKIEKDIIEWKGYLNHHNENIFSNSDFRTILVINGYADAQGSNDESQRKEFNVKLSTERAKAVAKEFELQMKNINDKYKVDVQLEINGRGEDTPPNYKPGKKLDDGSRRICNINLVVGPKMLMYNEK
jgi:outer membrane protein OmpA-like peptidoglycan-associated protein